MRFAVPDDMEKGEYSGVDRDRKQLIASLLSLQVFRIELSSDHIAKGFASLCFSRL